MRSAISPRLAMRIFSNIAARIPALFEDHEGLAELDGAAILDEDAGEPAGARRADLVHHLHRLDDEDDLPLRDVVAELDESRRLRGRGEIGGADHRRLDRARMFGCGGGCRCNLAGG